MGYLASCIPHKSFSKWLKWSSELMISNPNHKMKMCVSLLVIFLQQENAPLWNTFHAEECALVKIGPLNALVSQMARTRSLNFKSVPSHPWLPPSSNIWKQLHNTITSNNVDKWMWKGVNFSHEDKSQVGIAQTQMNLQADCTILSRGKGLG